MDLCCGTEGLVLKDFSSGAEGLLKGCRGASQVVLGNSGSGAEGLQVVLMHCWGGAEKNQKKMIIK